MQTKENNRTQFNLFEGDTFTTVIAEPKAGKTSLAVSLTLDAIFNGNQRVLFVNGKGGNYRELLWRVISILEDTSLKDLFTGKENIGRTPYFEQFNELANRQQFFFTHGPENDLPYFLKEIKRFVKEQAIDCVLFDNFHHVKYWFEEEWVVQALFELGRKLQIPTWVFLPQSGQKTSHEAALYTSLSRWSDWVIQLHRPPLATKAHLHLIKHPYDEIPVKIPLQFSAKTAHFVDVEMIEQHWVNEIRIREETAKIEAYKHKKESFSE